MKVKIFDQKDCDRTMKYVFENEHKWKGETRNEGRGNDYGEKAPNTKIVYSDPLFHELGEKAKPFVENTMHRFLYPTYTYCRFYKEGFILPRHQDRPSCEISVSVTFGYGDRDEPWEFWMERWDGEYVKSMMEPGEGWVYRGCIEPHWRPMLDKGWQFQAFFHYITIGGPIYQHLLRLGADLSKPWTDMPIEFINPVSYNYPKYDVYLPRRSYRIALERGIPQSAIDWEDNRLRRIVQENPQHKERLDF